MVSLGRIIFLSFAKFVHLTKYNKIHPDAIASHFVYFLKFFSLSFHLPHGFYWKSMVAGSKVCKRDPYIFV